MPVIKPAAIPAATESKPSRAPAKRTKPARTSPKGKLKSATASQQRRSGSKKEKILKLLKRPEGASLQQLQKATGWQAHSVRGFLSGAIKKRLGLPVHSHPSADGTRVYRIAAK